MFIQTDPPGRSGGLEAMGEADSPTEAPTQSLGSSPTAGCLSLPRGQGFPFKACLRVTAAFGAAARSVV